VKFELLSPRAATLAAAKDDPDPPALGLEARRLREARDLPQEELADRAGLHPNYIGRIERGESNIGVKALFKLARGLGVSPAVLFEQ
jgi:transcriptional regulator with XRE-family HTH domain